MNYQPSNSALERLRSLFRKRVRDAELAVLGDSSSTGARVDIPDKPGYVYIRFPAGKDVNGFALYSPPTIARDAGVAYVNAPGMPVYVAYGDNGELEIKSAQYRALDQMGINTSVLNPLNQQSKWVYGWQLTVGLASAVATAATESTLVTVKKFLHYVGNTFAFFDTPLEADKIDLAAYIPGVDEHCYACVWIDTYTNEAVVTTSIPQDLLTEPLDITDLNELIARTAASRPPDAIPLKAFYLANDQTTIKQTPYEVDLRQWLNTPKPWGFPTDLATRERVRPGYTFISGTITPNGVGALTVETGGRHIIVPLSNWSAVAVPTVSDDETLGYSVGSQWIDTLTETPYILLNASTGAAVWKEIVTV